MSLHLITGHLGQEHITAADHASFNIAMFGAGEFVLDRGNKFKVEIVSNNLIKILDGDMMIQGRHVRLAENTYEELMIDNGTQGMKRNDLIVARYSKDATTGIENCEFVVLKGTENAGEAVDATYTTGDITENGNDLVTEYPLYRIRLNGLNIQSVDTLFTIGHAIQSEIDELKSAVGHSKKNLLKYPYYSSTVSQLGVTFTVNSDGTIATSGTSTNLTSFAMSDRQTSTLKLRAGTYIVSGCPQGGSESTYRIAISKTNKDGVGERVASDFGNGAIFTLEEDALIGVYIDVLSTSVNMAGLVFKPMIRYASIEDDTYEPYVADVQTQIDSKIITLKTGLTLIIQGKLAILKFEGYGYTNNGTIITDDKYKPHGQIYRNMVRAHTSDGKYYDGLASVKNDGTITMSYIPSQGSGPQTNVVSSAALYGEIVYVIA